MPTNPKIERVLDRVEPGRRDAMRRILAGAVYAAPIVASFSMASLDANAQPSVFCGNQTTVPGAVAPSCDTPVPMMSPWSLVGLAGAVSAAGAWLLHRRRGG